MSVSCIIDFICAFTFLLFFQPKCEAFNMITVNTWDFTNATENAWKVLESGGSALDAVELGCTTCEKLQCDGTVGFGGSPDEHGETTLDAMIMNAENHGVGAVGCLQRVKRAVSVARAVMEHTRHTLLVGDLATQFALQLGFEEENLTTTTSRDMYRDWRKQRCQPNFWTGVTPDPTKSCGPYRRNRELDLYTSAETWVSAHAHDTIGMLALDQWGKMAVATSTNGAAHKIPGRVGDSPIPGAGAYTSRGVGGAVATGDGDVMMRFLPTMLAVEFMRAGESPTSASRRALRRIVEESSDFRGALVALDASGNHGAACHGLGRFPYSVADKEGLRVIKIQCT